MTAPPTTADEELAAALRLGGTEGLTRLHQGFGLRIARYLKRVTWGLLSPEDLQDVYQDTLLAFWRQLHGSAFRAEQALGLVQAIARRKGIDVLRRRGHRARTNNDTALAQLEAGLGDSELGRTWRDHMGPAERAELRQVLLESIATLPDRQRLVARVFVDNFEDFGPRDLYEPLTRAVEAVTGQPESVGAIKSVWRAARTTLADELSRRGYCLD